MLQTKRFFQPLMPETKSLILVNEDVVACRDVERLFDNCTTKWQENTTVHDVKTELEKMMHAIQNISFCLDYELPLNKRFTNQFKQLVESKGFVVTDTLPQDGVTIFGKSQPDMIIYKSKGGFMRGRSVMGATICIDTPVDQQAWEVTGATLELKRNPVHLKSKSPALAQSCANMVRVSGFLTERALLKGYIVEEITILGLLVSHSSSYCIPLRYNVRVNEATITHERR